MPFENTVMERGFPDNLYFDVTDTEVDENSAKDWNATLMYLLSRFPVRTMDILMKRYQDGLSYRNIGAIHKMSGARAEAIVSDAISELRKNRQLLITGIEKALEEKRIAQKALPYFSESATEFDEVQLSELDLSTRSYNALKNNGVNTVGDIIRLGNKLADIHALGAKSLCEILIKLTKINVDVKKYFNRIVIGYHFEYHKL